MIRTLKKIQLLLPISLLFLGTYASVASEPLLIKGQPYLFTEKNTPPGFTEFYSIKLDANNSFLTKQTSSHLRLDMVLGDNHHWDMALEETFLMEDHYTRTVVSDSGEIVSGINKNIRTYKGTLLNQEHSSVLITIGPKFISGEIKGVGNHSTRFENSTLTSQGDSTIILKVVENQHSFAKKTCGVVTEMTHHDFKNVPHTDKSSSCKQVEVYLVADYLAVTESGGIGRAESRLISLINQSNAIYKDLNIELRLVGTRLSSSSSSDAWSTGSTDLTKVLEEYTAWAANNITTPSHSLSALLTGSSFSLADGLAWQSGMCSGKVFDGFNHLVLSYQISATNRPEIFCHEIGHLFGSGHVNGGPYIMNLSATAGAAWSPSTEALVDNFKSDPNSCLKECGSVFISEKKNEHSFFVYPNPSYDGQLNFLLDQYEDGAYVVSLIDQMGKVHVQKTVHSWQEDYFIDVSSLTQGLYLLSIRSQEKNYTKQIVIH